MTVDHADPAGRAGVLAVRGLVVEIGGHRLLDGIDLDVGPQERVALLARRARASL